MAYGSGPLQECAPAEVEYSILNRGKYINGPNSKLRVCHLIASLQYGGAERQFVNVMNWLPCQERYAVFLRPATTTGLYPLLDAAIGAFSLNVRQRRYAPLYVARLVRFLRQTRIDVLHTHTFWASFYGAIAARLAGVRVFITSEHGKNPWKNSSHRWIERNLISSRAFARICVSEDILHIRRDIDGIPAVKLVVIPNGTILPEPFVREESQVLRIGSLGRLIEAKDYVTLLRSAALLRDKGRKFKLLLVGDGPERRRLEKEAASADLRNHVEFVGFQSNTELWLKKFDIFAMSSIREGQPMALLEAMAHGVPVVATRVGGIPSTVTHGEEGLLVEPRDPVALAAALDSLMQAREFRERLGAGARQRVVAEFSIQSVCHRYMDLYKRAYADG